LGKCFQRHCEIARFYGINPFGLPDDALIALEANIPCLIAKERLREVETNPDRQVTPDYYLQLWRQVFGVIVNRRGEVIAGSQVDEDRAQDAAGRYAWRQAREAT
jgi:hypothetical protein